MPSPVLRLLLAGVARRAMLDLASLILDDPQSLAQTFRLRPCLLRGREHSPEAGTAGLRAVRELAAIVLVCSKAIEGVADVLAGSATMGPAPSAAGRYGYRSTYDQIWDYEDEP